MPKVIRDSIYGFIKINEPFLKIIESKPFQRLRYIKQLGLGYLVYPSANHTRFEHSLGCFYLAEKMADKFNFAGENEFKAAALLHDLGHTPFSHALEEVLEFTTGSSHEKQTEKIIRESEIKRIIQKSDLDLEKIIRFIKKKEVFGQLISGEIDVDRLDYLARDAYHTGVAFGIIDSDLVIKAINFKKGKFYVKNEYVPALESILIARHMMYPTVYNHHTVRIAKTMFQNIVLDLINKKTINPSDLFFMTDEDIISVIKKEKESKKAFEKIEYRELYKLAVSFSKEDVKERLKSVLKSKDDLDLIQKVQNMIAEDLNLKKGEILIDIPEKSFFKNSNITVLENGKKLEKFSPLIKSLQEAQWNYWYIGVYCPQELREKTKKAKKKIKRCLLKNLC